MHSKKDPEGAGSGMALRQLLYVHDNVLQQAVSFRSKYSPKTKRRIEQSGNNSRKHMLYGHE